MARNTALLYDSHDYYKRMFELQDKLRKSEEERIRLEERFNVLVRESGNRHNACINRLRVRYIHYLEEQRTRDDRNHKLLAALDGVMNKLALINAKKERLNILRKQYEAYLLRVYASRQAPGSVTGDSGIASQHEDRNLKKIAAMETRKVPSPRATHQVTSLQTQSTWPRSTTFATMKFHHHDILPSSQPILPTASASTIADRVIDRHQASYVPHMSRVHASPISQSDDRFVHRVPASPTRDTRRYPQMTSSFEEGAFPSDPRDPSSQIAQHATARPVLSMSTADPNLAVRADPVNPVERFFRERPSVDPMRFPAGVTSTRRFEDESIPRRFDLPASYRYPDAGNIIRVMSDPRSRIGKYDTFDGDAVVAKSSAYLEGQGANAHQLVSLPGYADYTLTSSRRSEDEGSVRSLTSDDVDDLIRRSEHPLWRNADVAKMSHRPSIVLLGANDADLDENGRTTAILENELDRYISNIRKLHREHGVQRSFEELDQEQNTSGDLLNVSLSEEDALELPAEDRKDKKERIPETAGEDVLASADDDLVSNTANSPEVAHPATESQVDGDASPLGVENGSERSRDLDEEISIKNDIRRDNIATLSTGFKRFSEDRAEIAEKNWDEEVGDHLTESRETMGNEVEMVNSSSHGESRVDANRGEIMPQEKQIHPVVTGEESNMEDSFDVAEELAPWDLAGIQKRVLELRLNDAKDDQEEEAVEAINKVAKEPRDLSPLVEQSDSGVEEPVHPADTLPRAGAEAETAVADANKLHDGRNDAHARVEAIASVPSEISSHPETDQPAEDHTAEEFSAPNRDNSDETAAEGQIGEQLGVERSNDEYNNLQQEYIEENESSQAQRYETQQDPNEPYIGYGEQNMTYGNESGKEYEEYQRYASQGYAQEDGQYVEYVDGQYEQYPEDPAGSSQQQDPNAQYEQDPGYQAYYPDYDPNQRYDRGDDPDGQYDPNQGYGDDPNQAYSYTTEPVYDAEQGQYDSNAYEEQGYQQEQRVEDGRAVEDREEETETHSPTLQGLVPQADPQSPGPKSDEGEEGERSEGTLDVTANGADQSKEKMKQKKDVIKSLLDSDTTDTTIERNTVSNTESDFDFN